MRLFDKHSSENEAQAKAALVEVAAHNIGKYIIAQEFLNASLSGGSGSGKKGSTCLLCKVDRLTKVMSKLESQLGQIMKTHELMFGSQLDVQSIVDSAAMEFYPLTRAKRKDGPINGNRESFLEGKPSSSKGSDFDADVPQEIKDISSLIKSVVKGMSNGEVDVNIVEVTGKGTTIFGVNPADHKDFKSLFKAIILARREQVKERLEDILSNGTPGEEVIKEATIHNAEETAETVGAESSSSSSPSSNGEEKPKRTKSSGSKPN